MMRKMGQKRVGSSCDHQIREPVLIIGLIGANPFCALPIFIFWHKSETRAWFGKGS